MLYSDIPAEFLESIQVAAQVNAAIGTTTFLEALNDKVKVKVKVSLLPVHEVRCALPAWSFSPLPDVTTTFCWGLKTCRNKGVNHHKEIDRLS